MLAGRRTRERYGRSQVVRHDGGVGGTVRTAELIDSATGRSHRRGGLAFLEQGFDERRNRGVEVFEKILFRRNIDVLKEMPVLDKSQ